MEFVDLSRYLDLKNPKFLPFSELRTMQPVWMTQDLQLSDRPGNREHANELAKKSIAVIPIRREPPFEKYLDRTSFPRRILFEMTNRCNFLCRMCPQQHMERTRMDMAGDLYRNVIDEINHHGVEGLWLYHLGESIVHPEFKENLHHISTKKNLGIIWMSTNGEKFTEDIIRCVLKSNIHYINFSAHAVTEKTYKTIALQGSFDVVQNNLKKLYEIKGTKNLPRKPFIHCQMIEQETTKHEIDAFIKTHYRNADIVSVNMLEYVHFPNNAFGYTQRERKPLSTCLRVSRNDCIVLSNGVVTVCDADYNGTMEIGNVNKESLYDIWNGPKRQEILRRNEAGRMFEDPWCAKCTDYDI